MQFSLDVNFECFTIQKHGLGQITIKHPIDGQSSNSTAQVKVETLNSSFVIAPNKLIKNWSPNTISTFGEQDLKPILELHPEVVLLGTGAKLQFPDMSLTAQFWQANIGFEIMDTAAACRTYNILVNEGRFTVAGIILDNI